MRTISDYSKRDFIALIAEIISDAGSEAHQDELLERFIELSEHPAGSDLIYYPEPGEQPTPEAIAEKIQQWRQANGKPGFKF
ncbi:bacteriocin immunity protein [Rouxiella aceris]|uniref:bacteriocin immunity protein n=1 Tax=Rouxiella aceris TaxID=2703884 RepID=UPI001B7D59CB|nr:bacteriocin immunity protein [Rouxiella aceris]